MTKVREIVESFFKSVKAQVDSQGDSIIVRNIPEKIQKTFSMGASEEFSFEQNGPGQFVEENSQIFRKIKDYLRNSPSRTLLKIDFEFPKNIHEKINLRNCSLDKIEKKHQNNYFSRFTFLTTFRYLNNNEQTLNEIYVHEKKVVNGDLSDYDVKEGNAQEANTSHLAEDYNIAKEKLKEILGGKITDLSGEVNSELDKEVKRINEHYAHMASELDLNKQRLIARMKENLEEAKTQKFKETLDKSEEEFKKIEREKEEIINNEKTKYTLDIDNKIINTTIIYYPVFKITFKLSDAKSEKELEIIYNPLTEEISKINCDSCKVELEELNICNGGHICCNSCLHLCSECGKRFCKECFSGICNSCGKLVCKNCGKKCSDCGKINCKNCMRKTTSAIEKCKDCIVYCPICSKITDKISLVRDSSGRMICKSCSIRSKMRN